MGKILCLLLVGSWLILHSQCTRKQEFHEGWWEFKEGVRLCEAGDLSSAEKLMREAIELDHTESKFLNGMGVVMLRGKRYEEAKHYFAEALLVDRHDESAQENFVKVKEIIEYMKEEEEKVNRRPEHNLKCPPQYKLKDLSSPKSEKISQILSKPFVIREAIAHASTIGILPHKGLLGFRKLRYKYGNAKVDYYPYSITHPKIKPFFLSLTESLELLSDPSLLNVRSSQFSMNDNVELRQMRKNATGQYIQWNLDYESWRLLLIDVNFTVPSVLDDSWLSVCLRSKNEISDFYLKTHWKMLLIGEESSGMFIHQDTLRTSSWQLQLAGSKRWHVCAPDQSVYLYNEAGVVDSFYPNYDEYPLFRQANCYDFTVYPGDFTYYPSDYWHQTQNIKLVSTSGYSSVSIALSSSHVDRASYREVKEQFQLECGGRKAIFSVDPQIGNRTEISGFPNICSRIDDCFSELWWQLGE